jgi:hypothetical protein
VISVASRFRTARIPLRQTQMLQLILTLGDYLVFVNPHIAISRKHIHVGAGLPIRMGLAPIRIAKGNMHPWVFLVLQ